ncbi:uncharacterized protein Z520_04084 [Fonsecaea multimorphosa CBS 102226]|uniref:SnoaL-like domain-containing protein n=1 Tax=Fonsecaea multimorphosa CBS 102226 TaxID=1442371 RepID=A0A0D2KUK5_9EURO|nr:uncharacterized protein Z520_04084 [Fonsecaea multimorphosa CBS 102226]KIY00399.1 hypothetical protein Z520_04084 [Fonsecaea multimorphosa CBS 102226]OAL26915.1 hypothetical protein AYO22_03859 [Fonsecaea multimorphosa]
MSVPTKAAFVHYGDFDSTTRKLPVMEFMERFRDDFDTKSFDPKWYAPDFTYVAPDGTVSEGRDKALDAMKALYGPLPKWCHEAFYLNCYELDDSGSYEMIGKATLWANLPGEPAQGESKKTDGEGKKWDLAIPGTYLFNYAKAGDGFVLKRIELTGDTGPLMVGLLRRGVLSSKDLGL